MLNIRRKADSLHCMLQMDKPQALVVTLNIIKMIAAILYSVHSSNSVCKHKVCRNIGFQQPTIQTIEWFFIQVSVHFISLYYHQLSMFQGNNYNVNDVPKVAILPCLL